MGLFQQQPTARTQRGDQAGNNACLAAGKMVQHGSDMNKVKTSQIPTVAE